MKFLKYCLSKTNFKRNTFSRESIEEIMQTNPKNFIVRGKNPYIKVFKIEYSYTTLRDNKKEGSKLFVYYEGMAKHFIENDFEKWVSQYNNENRGRKEMRNVYCNNIIELGDVSISTEDL